MSLCEYEWVKCGNMKSGREEIDCKNWKVDMHHVRICVMW